MSLNQVLRTAGGTKKVLLAPVFSAMIVLYSRFNLGCLPNNGKVIEYNRSY